MGMQAGVNTALGLALCRVQGEEVPCSICPISEPQAVCGQLPLCVAREAGSVHHAAAGGTACALL